MRMFDYDRDMMQPPEEQEQASMWISDAVDVDMWVMKYD